MGFVENLLSLRDFVRQHRRSEIFEGHGIFCDNHGLGRSYIGEAPAKEETLLFAGRCFRRQNTWPDLRDQKRMIWKSSEIALLPRNDRFGNVSRQKLPLRRDEFKMKGFGHDI